MRLRPEAPRTVRQFQKGQRTLAQDQRNPAPPRMISDFVRLRGPQVLLPWDRAASGVDADGRLRSKAKSKRSDGGKVRLNCSQRPQLTPRLGNDGPGGL